MKKLFLVVAGICVSILLILIFFARETSGNLSEAKSKIESAMFGMGAAASGWKIIYFNEKPTVKIDRYTGHGSFLLNWINSYKGYNILLRQESKHPAYLPQGGSIPAGTPYNTESSHIEFVLLPLKKTKTDYAALKNRIPWQNVEQEYFVKPVYLGQGMGFAWFGNMTLYEQYDVAEDFGLVEGEDRLLHLVGQRLDGAGRDGALLAGLAHAGDDLGAVELLAAAVLLEDGDGAQLDLLDGGEAAAAGQALAAAADAGLVGPGVRDLGVCVAAEGTVHGSGQWIVDSGQGAACRSC